ncbi:hypothetical protein, partial [Kitasatospora sp. NPDC059599]|uniref:hypothetical protein n=1 Tax=Kitasatospora sp. NPDC059599 TaxID=3346880 RepID=UPI0036A27C1A
MAGTVHQEARQTSADRSTTTCCPLASATGPASVTTRATGGYPSAMVLVIAVTLRPRLGRLPKDAGVLDRAGAPVLY